jgi:hypothetical protein
MAIVRPKLVEINSAKFLKINPLQILNAAIFCLLVKNEKHFRHKIKVKVMPVFKHFEGYLM